MTTEDFAKIFYSNFTPQTDWEELNEIYWMYEEKLFTIETIKFASHTEFMQRLDFVSSPKSGFVRSGESNTHIALKSFARDYLIKNLKIPEKDILYEHLLIGFEVDVIDRMLQFPVECGDTYAQKLEKYLNLPNTKSFSIIPYPRMQDIVIYIFAATLLFFQYIEFKNSYQNNQRAKLR